MELEKGLEEEAKTMERWAEDSGIMEKEAQLQHKRGNSPVKKENNEVESMKKRQ